MQGVHRKGCGGSTFRAEKGKGDKENEVSEKPPKNKKLSHSNYNSSKFGTIVDHFSKPATPLAPICNEALMKEIKVEAMHRDNEETKREEEQASKAT